MLQCKETVFRGIDQHIFIYFLQLKVAQGANYKLEESVTMETELIELRAQKHMTALQVHN